MLKNLRRNSSKRNGFQGENLREVLVGIYGNTMLKTILGKEVRRCTVDKLVSLQFLVAILCESRMKCCFKMQQNFLRK